MSERRINEKYRQKAKALGVATQKCERKVEKIKETWLKHYILLEKSLADMKEGLFDNPAVETISVTGQNLICNVAERAHRYTHDAGEVHRIQIHPRMNSLLRLIDRNVEICVQQVFKMSKFIEYELGCDEPFTSMIHDYVTMEGFNTTSNLVREEANLIKPEIQDPETLSKIVTDLRFGNITSSLDYISQVHPKDEIDLRNTLQTQIVVDCIEKDNYTAAVEKMKLYKDDLCGDIKKAPRLIGALLMGKASKKDSRYKEFFRPGQRDLLKSRMASFFVDPRNSPLKEILAGGCSALTFMTATGGGYTDGFYTEPELPINIDVSSQAHSAFACPILKEQSTPDNPAIRLVCGHVVSRDAINRLTTNLRPIRSNSRSARFKCPYCPKEQYMDGSRRIDFSPWAHMPFRIEEISDEEVAISDSDDDERLEAEIEASYDGNLYINGHHGDNDEIDEIYEENLFLGEEEEEEEDGDDVEIEEFEEEMSEDDPDGWW